MHAMLAGLHVSVDLQASEASQVTATHFALLQRNTGVAFEKMVFFDDCNWGDNCARVARGCKGVVTQKTPHGLCKEAWALCLAKYVEAVERRA